LEILSTEAQSAKQSHITSDSINHAVLEQLRYVQAIQQLAADSERIATSLQKINATHAVSTLKDGLLALKTHLVHIYTTARTYSTLVSPIGRQHHRTWENTLVSHYRSPLKRDNPRRPDSVGMRLLLPSELTNSVLSVLESISKHASSLTQRWLDNEENLELTSQVASKIASNFSKPSSDQHPLLPELSSVDLQVPQRLFWICRTSQELKTLLVGPPIQNAPLSCSPRLLSPRMSSHSESKALLNYIHSYGAASVCFARYWTLFEPMLENRFSRLSIPQVKSLKDLEAYLRDVHDINARVWIMMSMVWADTPELLKRRIDENLCVTLEDYLAPDWRAAVASEAPVSVPQLCLFSLPHVQVEQLSLRFAGIVDSALLPVYEQYARLNPTLEDAMASLSQLNLFWANARSGPWYALAKSNFSAPLLVMRFLPAVQSIRAAATLCAACIESSTPEDKAAYHDLAIWTQKNPANAFFAFLTSCLCMMVCCPGLLSVEDFLLDSLSTPLTKKSPELTMTTCAKILQFITHSDALPDSNQSFWTQEAVVHVLDILKLGSIRTVLQLRLQEILLPKPASSQ
jgi:hypothetical protein